MRAFTCRSCGQLVFFENSECLRCHAALGFAPDRRALLTLEADEKAAYERCANAVLAECNWLVPTPADDGALCLACALTRTRPSDDDPEGLAAFAETEAAKRRLVFQLLELDLPVVPYDEDDDSGLAFDLLSSQRQAVMIGHDDGLITLDVAESDDAHREQVRLQLGEAYRTMLGHLRHEIGHYYWPLLVGEDDERTARSRALFGDETLDYQAALDRHYGEGPAPDWPEHHVSAYATMHPWEDWAETFAHYLHIRDTLETAAAFGVQVKGPVEASPDLDVEGEPFAAILEDWLPLTYAVNALNRSMGKDDLYPFVLAPEVIQKLAFVHEVVTVSPAGPES